MEAHDCSWFEFSYRPGAVCINDRCPGHRAMRALAANLTIGAALCRADFIGRKSERHRQCAVIGEDCRHAWQPGSGKPAP